MQQNRLYIYSYKQRNWFSKNFIEILIFFIGLIFILLLFFAKKHSNTDALSKNSVELEFDFISGLIGSILSLITIIFLYSTLKNQRESSKLEKFENKYFELIKMHRDNVAEIGIGNNYGKKIFVLLIREFREILKIAKDISKKEKIVFSYEELFIISYYALFFGVGPNSSRMLRIALKEYNYIFVNEFLNDLNRKKNKIKKKRKFSYTPFEGHQSRLGHYYRHLYQTVSYVNKQTIDIDKYEYIKTIRAQLTTHEQALLFINCLTPIGKVWWDENLLIGYRFVKNIPYGFFDTDSEINLSSYFPKDYFEYQENIEKNQKYITQPS